MSNEVSLVLITSCLFKSCKTTVLVRKSKGSDGQKSQNLINTIVSLMLLPLLPIVQLLQVFPLFEKRSVADRLLPYSLPVLFWKSRKSCKTGITGKSCKTIAETIVYICCCDSRPSKSLISSIKTIPFQHFIYTAGKHISKTFVFIRLRWFDYKCFIEKLWNDCANKEN